MRGFGADQVIDVRAEAFDESGAAYDVVIDIVGGAVLERSFRVLRRPSASACGTQFCVRSNSSNSPDD